MLGLPCESRTASDFRSTWGEAIADMTSRLDGPNVITTVEPATDITSAEDGVTPPMSWPRSCTYICDDRTAEVTFSLSRITRRPSPVVYAADENAGAAESP